MAEKKITKREKFEMLLPLVADNTMLTEFVTHEIELLSSKSGKVSAKRTEEVDTFLELLRDVLADAGDKGMQCGAITKERAIAEFEWSDGKETSSQRVSAMLKKLTDCGDVVKFTDKKVTLFRLA